MENKKKSVGKNNEKVSRYIHDDIVFSILYKLPLKSLKRFGCVRKSWSLLLQNTPFMNLFRNNFISNSHRAPIMLKVFESEEDVLYSFSGQRFENKIKLDCPNLFEEDFNNFQIFGLGSSDGTLCLHELSSCKITLWNPITNLLNLIPPSPVESYVPDAVKDIYITISCLHGFGYDRGTCDYKVIRRVHFVGQSFLGYDLRPYVPFEDLLGDTTLDQVWEIYSLRSNSWKKLDFHMPGYLYCDEGIQAYMDGFCHWLCKDNSPVGPCLVSFNLSNEVFFTTPIPSDVDDCFDVKAKWINLAVLNGSIALLSYNEKITTFNISILSELGVKESWTKLFVIGSLSCVWYPIGMGTRGEIFFVRKDEQLAWFDLSTQTIEELAYNTMWFDCRIIIYNKSIFPIGGISS
jgi:molecular chaperone HtpG